MTHSAKRRRQRRARRGKDAVDRPDRLRPVDAVVAHRPNQPPGRSEPPNLGRRKGFRHELVGRMDLDVERMIDGQELDLIEVQHLAELVGDLQDIGAIARLKDSRVAEQDDLIRVRRQKNLSSQRQSDGRVAQQVGHETKPTPIPGVQKRARSGGYVLFQNRQRRRGQLHVDPVLHHTVGPEGLQGIQVRQSAEPDFNGKPRDGSGKKAPAIAQLDVRSDPAGVGLDGREPNLELTVEVPTLVTQDAKLRARRQEQQIRVAVPIDVQRNHLLDRRQRDASQSGFFADVHPFRYPGSVACNVPPELHRALIRVAPIRADDAKIQPAVVVVVHKFRVGWKNGAQVDARPVRLAPKQHDGGCRVQ